MRRLEQAKRVAGTVIGVTILGGMGFGFATLMVGPAHLLETLGMLALSAAGLGGLGLIIVLLAAALSAFDSSSFSNLDRSSVCVSNNEAPRGPGCQHGEQCAGQLPHRRGRSGRGRTRAASAHRRGGEAVPEGPRHPEQAQFIATVPLPIVASTLRRGRPVSTAISLMKKAMAAASKPKETEVTGPTLDDLHGLGEAGEWGRELARDLADWRVGKIGWADVDRGILVSGPTGTGKTTFARALARTCGIHLVLGSIARLAGQGPSRRHAEGDARGFRRSPEESAVDHLHRRDRRRRRQGEIQRP